MSIFSKTTKKTTKIKSMKKTGFKLKTDLKAGGADGTVYNLGPGDVVDNTLAPKGNVT